MFSVINNTFFKINKTEIKIVLLKFVAESLSAHYLKDFFLNKFKYDTSIAEGFILDLL